MPAILQALRWVLGTGHRAENKGEMSLSFGGEDGQLNYNKVCEGT